MARSLFGIRGLVWPAEPKDKQKTYLVEPYTVNHEPLGTKSRENAYIGPSTVKPAPTLRLALAGIIGASAAAAGIRQKRKNRRGAVNNPWCQDTGTYVL